MALQMTRTDEEAKIRTLIDDWATAARAKDVDAIFAHYAPDIGRSTRSLSCSSREVDAYRKHWEACMTMCSGPMIFEVHDLDIEARDDMALGHYLSRCGGTGTCGNGPDGCAPPSVAAR